jgi:hypothetical protein
MLLVSASHEEWTLHSLSTLTDVLPTGDVRTARRDNNTTSVFPILRLLYKISNNCSM